MFLRFFKPDHFITKNADKKYTMAISVLKKKNEKKALSSSGPSRIRRTGDLGKKLFPKYCMLCKKLNPIVVEGKKQYPQLLDLYGAELAIKEAAKIHNDDVLLAAIEATSSLRAAANFVYMTNAEKHTLEFAHRRLKEQGLKTN